MSDTLDLLEQRVGTLETLVGKADKLDQTKGFDCIQSTSSRLANYLGEHPKISNLIKNSSNVQKYTDFAALDEIEDEHLVKAKMALVLQEEHNIRQLNNDFEHLQNLAKILDNKSLNDIPSLMEKLKNLSSNYCELRVEEQAYTMQVKEFLATYFTTIKSISESMENMNEYLD